MSFSGLQEGQLPLRVAEALEADGYWCSIPMLSALIPDAGQKTIARAVRRLADRGIIEIRLQDGIDPSNFATYSEAKFVRWLEAPPPLRPAKYRTGLGDDIERRLAEAGNEPVPLTDLEYCLGVERRHITRNLRRLAKQGKALYQPGRDGFAQAI